MPSSARHHPRRLGRSRRRCLRLSLLLLGLWLAVPHTTPAWGQAAWEFSPYQVQVWIAQDDAPELAAITGPRLDQFLADRAETVFGAVWKLELAPAPALLATEILGRIENISIEQVRAISKPPKLAKEDKEAKAAKDAVQAKDTVPAKDVLRGDKLYCVALAAETGRIHIRVRELDCRARTWGPVLERWTAQPAAAPWEVWDAIVDSFTPIVKIETVEMKQIGARLRAGGLIVDPASPALIQPGMVLRPIIRRNERHGEPLKGGVQAISWTLLEVQSRSDAVLICELYSCYRAPIPTKSGPRTDRLAILAKPRHASTRVSIRSRAAKSDWLSGYEIYSKGKEPEPNQLLGVTDWRGSIEIPRGDQNLRVLLVRNGAQLLARLPLAPGFEAEAVATTIEDDTRLEAEGFITALQGRILDLEARREILKSRIRAKIRDNNLAEAQTLLAEFRSLEGRAEIRRDMDRELSEISKLKVGEKITTARINVLFVDAGKLLGKFLDPDLTSILTKELDDAKKGVRPAGG